MGHCFLYKILLPGLFLQCRVHQIHPERQVDQGLYGLVVLGLKDPFHAGIYVFSMFALGLHLSHSVQSMCQTFGLVSKVGLPRLIQISQAIGLFIAVAYSSIPIYILAVL
jgi:hypothetical protein